MHGDHATYVLELVAVDEEAAAERIGSALGDDLISEIDLIKL